MVGALEIGEQNVRIGIEKDGIIADPFSLSRVLSSGQIASWRRRCSCAAPGLRAILKA